MRLAKTGSSPELPSKPNPILQSPTNKPISRSRRPNRPTPSLLVESRLSALDLSLPANPSSGTRATAAPPAKGFSGLPLLRLRRSGALQVPPPLSPHPSLPRAYLARGSMPAAALSPSSPARLVSDASLPLL